jgi:hypothetical protein
LVPGDARQLHDLSDVLDGGEKLRRIMVLKDEADLRQALVVAV